MAKSIAMMADEILGGMLTNKATNPSEVLSETRNSAAGEGELPELSDSARSQLIGESLEYLDELDLSQPAQRSPEQQKKKAEWEKKNREKRNMQARSHSIRGSRLEPGETHRQASHKAGRGKKKGEAGHVSDRPQGNASPSNSRHWRHELERTKNPKGPKGASQTLIPGKGGQKFAKDAHKAAINRSRKARGATELAGVGYMKTDKTMTLIDASSHRERIANKKMMGNRPLTAAEKSQKRKTYKRKPGTLDSEAAKHGSSVVGQNYEGKDSNWIQGAEKDIEKRGTEGVCTGDKFGGPSCPPGSKRYNLAKTFKKMGKKRDKETVSKKEKAEKNESMWSNMTPEHLDILSKAKDIIDEMTAAGSIGTNMAGSANIKYDVNGKPMGQDTPPIEPVDKSLRKTDKKGKKKDKKKKVSIKKESFENFLSLVVNEAQK